VYDGGGIEPDISVEKQELHPVVQTLHDQGFIFDYATQYANTYSAPSDPRTFSVTDQEYQQFLNWMKGRNYDYTSPLENKLITLQDLAKRERYYPDLKPQLEHLKNVIAENRKKELQLYKDQIKMILEQELMLRYFNERGSVETSFKYDNDLKKALDLLANTEQYRKVLNIP